MPPSVGWRTLRLIDRPCLGHSRPKLASSFRVRGPGRRRLLVRRMDCAGRNLMPAVRWAGLDAGGSGKLHRLPRHRQHLPHHLRDRHGQAVLRHQRQRRRRQSAVSAGGRGAGLSNLDFLVVCYRCRTYWPVNTACDRSFVSRRNS